MSFLCIRTLRRRGRKFCWVSPLWYSMSLLCLFQKQAGWPWNACVFFLMTPCHYKRRLVVLLCHFIYLFICLSVCCAPPPSELLGSSFEQLFVFGKKRCWTSFKLFFTPNTPISCLFVFYYYYFAFLSVLSILSTFQILVKIFHFFFFSLSLSFGISGHFMPF